MKSCARCGSELRSLNADGFCVRCLLEGGLDAPRSPPQAGPAAESEPAFLVRSFGDYQLLEEIARGGMGVVYRARQTSLDRIVALKMILAGQFASKQVIQRFRGEVTAAALLQHPNIVAIHDVGIHDDQHYFSMDYVQGQNLSQLVGANPLPPARAARYVQLAAEAIHYAHDQGILHRDLKPSNVLIDSATDQPRITDFGLAKRLNGESSLTLTGQVLGSPNFMPPEQAGSVQGKIGRASDVYGLGAILYYLLVARPPFQADSLQGIVTEVIESEPIAPRSLNLGVPRDLETICLKCLAKDPHKRYSTAHELGNELERFLRHEPIQARPVTCVERTWRWCGRNPVVASLWVALVLAIFLGFTGITSKVRQLSREESITRQNLYTADMNLAYQAWNEGSLQRAQNLLQAHKPQDGKEDLRGFEWRYLWNLCQDESQFTFRNIPFRGERNKLALDAKAQALIVAAGDSLKWLDVPKRREMQSRAVGPPAITRLAVASGQPGLIAYWTDRIHALSPTGEALLSGSLSSSLGSGPNLDYDGAFAFSWDGTLLAVSGTNRMVRTFDECMVRIFDVATGHQVGKAFNLGEEKGIGSLAFSPDGRYLACGTLGTKIHILEAPSLKPVNVITGHTANVCFLGFDRAGSKLVSNSSDSHIRVWSFPGCQPFADFPAHDMQSDPALSPDGQWLASGGMDHTVRLWNLRRLELPPIFLHGHVDRVNSVLFSKDGRELYSGSNDGTVKVWIIPSEKSTNILSHPDWTDEVDFSPDGTFLAVADFDAGSAVLWNVARREWIGNVGEHSKSCRSVKFSADGKLIATAGDDGNVQISDVSTRKRNYFLPIIADGSRASLAFHPSNPLFATARGDLRFWDLRDRNRKNLLPNAPAEGVASVAFSRDGGRLALGMNNGKVSIWDLVKKQELLSFHEHSFCAIALCFSHDGHLLASGGYDNRVITYDLRKRVSTRLEGHFDTVFGLAFAPDDRTLVSTSWDGTIRFWCMANHQVALTLAHDAGGVNSVAFSPDGNLMVTSGSDGTARLWPATPLDFDVSTASKRPRADRK